MKRKNTHPHRSDREGQMAGMSAYPGEDLLLSSACLFHADTIKFNTVLVPFGLCGQTSNS